jgi:hypothetical protein
MLFGHPDGLAPEQLRHIGQPHTPIRSVHGRAQTQRPRIHFSGWVCGGSDRLPAKSSFRLNSPQPGHWAGQVTENPFSVTKCVPESILSDGHSLQKLNFKEPCISRIELPFASVVIEVNAAPGFAGFVLLQFGLGAPQFG